MTGSPAGIPLVAVIADDLTSAADGAAPFVGRGMDALLVMEPPARLPPTSLLSIDINSRAMPLDEAVAAAETCASRLRDARWLYKTVDSTLRGHIKEEIAASARGAGRSKVVFAPAFPAAGRTTRGGLQYVNGQLVTETDFARDPVHPVRSARLADAIETGTVDCVLIDAEFQEDLDLAIARIDSPEDVIFVGSPGMARALAARIAPDSSAPHELPRTSGRALVVVGSANPVSREQARAITSKEHVQLLQAPDKRRPSPHVVLGELVGDAVAALRDTDITLLVATGGETMRAILVAAGTVSLTLLGEVEPGFAVGITRLFERDVMVAMKAGGFGDARSLERAIDHLRGKEDLGG
jgi:uncharacterized protein YgbK (DUF1537 family)